MSPLAALFMCGGLAWHTYVARTAAAVAFVLLLGGLGFGWWHARKQLEKDEIDAALEGDFQRLERELARDDARDS